MNGGLVSEQKPDTGPSTLNELLHMFVGKVTMRNTRRLPPSKPGLSGGGVAMVPSP